MIIDPINAPEEARKKFKESQLPPLNSSVLNNEDVMSINKNGEPPNPFHTAINSGFQPIQLHGSYQPLTTMFNEQPKSPFKNAETLSQDDLIPAKEPNFDNRRGQTIEQGQGENGSAPVTKSDNATPRSQEQMAQGLLEKDNLNPKHRVWLASKYGNSNDASNSNPVGDHIRETDKLGDFTPELKQAQDAKNNLQGDYGQKSPSPSTESSEQAGTELGDHQRLENLKQEKLDNTGTEAQSQNDSQSDRDRLSDLYSQKPSDTSNHQEQTEANNNSQF